MGEGEYVLEIHFVVRMTSWYGYRMSLGFG